MMFKMKISLSLCLVCCCVLLRAQPLSKTQLPKILGEGIVSTGDYETHAAFSPTGDSLYFLKCTADLNSCAICVSYHIKGKWTSPVIVPFSGKYLDVDPFVTKDGNTLYFVSNRPVSNGDTLHNDWDIWKVTRTGSNWGKPIHLDAPVNSTASEFYPTIADNGNLYFGSGRPGGKGASDIYCARSVNGKFAEPENLGDAVNTANNEYEPFIAPDESYIIYMATIPAGLVNADFYTSYRIDGKWTKAIKMQAPFNSPATEWAPKVTRNGQHFYFGSTRNKVTDTLPQHETLPVFEKRLRATGNGLGDIYYVDFSAIKIK
jgi:Tol biopolymer transport system component